MESLLFNLFDYQRFENNEKLSSLIRETGSRSADKTGKGFKQLSDDELQMAAGGVSAAEYIKNSIKDISGSIGT
jgi:hypothetical protein